MTFFDKMRDRYNVLIIGLIIIFLIITFRLATLTIVYGDMYRELSDTKRVKQLPITAPRGDIRDRYGRLLASTKPSFTVQVMKDEINKNNLNETALKLITILEENGENYVDEFPIQLNVFEYKEENYYLENTQNPEEEVIDIIINNNLIGELLDTYYSYERGGHQFSYLTGRKAAMVVESKGIEIPININIDNTGKVTYSFNDNVDIQKWKMENKISSNLDPKSVLVNLIGNDKKIIRKIMSNPIVRKLTYDLLERKGLSSNFKLVEYSFTFDEEYKGIKRDLIRKGINNVTMESIAKDDFINIIEQDAIINELFSKVFVIGNEENQQNIVPGMILLEMFSQKGIQLPIIVSIDEETGKVKYTFEDEQSKESFYRKENIENELTALDALIYIGKKTGFINDVITDERVKYVAQEVMLNNSINPKISISNWDYMPFNDKRSWLTKYGIKEIVNAEETFKALREKYDIDENISDYEARYVFIIREQLLKQGYRQYQPINIAYGIKNRTVAKISENNFDLPGVSVSIEPIRNYPMGETAAHILGYLGKISQSNEVKKYIEELGYSPNDIIGKTGVEAEFEEYLKGKDGSKFVEVDVFGNTIEVMEETEAIPGNDLFLTIDAELQKVAENALKHALEEIQKGGEFKSKWGNYRYGVEASKGRPYKYATSGAVVAIDVKTGEVLALANYPAYDPNLFSTGISAEDWESLMPEHEEDPLAPRPLYNIAIRTAIQPGSTFKMITALAALEKGISPTKEIRDMGYLEIGNQRFGCWIWNSNRGTHGWENLYEAIRDSCNYYFYTVTLGKNLRTNEEIGIKVNIEDILRIADDFGLNNKSGIEIPGEVSGKIPDPSIKVNNKKNTLRRYLKENIKNYIKDDIELSEKEINKVIETIVSWINLEEPLSRGEVINRLSELGIDPEKKNERGINIADIIKYDYLNQAHWTQADTLNVSIGQGQNSYTPIQMANYIATLANGGYKNKVSVVQKITSFDGSETVLKPERKVERVTLRNYNFLEEVKKGMLMVTSDPSGTAYRVFKDFPVKVAAKTGTAEKDGKSPVTGEGYDNYAWFVAFAPYDDPQIAVAVVIFQGGHGGYAAPIVREIIAEYLGLNGELEKMTLSNQMVR